VAYDIAQADKMIPITFDTPDIFLDFNRPTITEADLYSPRKNGVVPAIFHGVKDGSASQIVRSKFLDNTSAKDLSLQTVFTYFQPVPGTNQIELQGQLKMWIESWASNGFNPVVLGPTAAAKSTLAPRILAALERVPGTKEQRQAVFLRYAALEAMGGGLMTHFDVVPGTLRPYTEPAKGFTALAEDYSAIRSDRAGILTFVEALEKWEQQPGQAVPNDAFIVPFTGEAKVVDVGAPGWQAAEMIHFSANAVAKTSASKSPSRAMFDYLRGVSV
jgi:hypothetical protein